MTVLHKQKGSEFLIPDGDSCPVNYWLTQMSSLVDAMERSPTWYMVLSNQGPEVRQRGFTSQGHPWPGPLGQVLLSQPQFPHLQECPPIRGVWG